MLRANLKGGSAQPAPGLAGLPVARPARADVLPAPGSVVVALKAVRAAGMLLSCAGSA
jgi:hypothetical protein